MLRGLNLPRLVQCKFGTHIWIDVAINVTPRHCGRGLGSGAGDGADVPRSVVVCSAGREPPGNPIKLIRDVLYAVGETARRS